MDTKTRPIKLVVTCDLASLNSAPCSCSSAFPLLQLPPCPSSACCSRPSPLTVLAVSLTALHIAYLIHHWTNTTNPPGTPKHCYINASSILQEHFLKCQEKCLRRRWFCSCSTLARKWLKQRQKITANNMKNCIPIMFATSNPIFPIQVFVLLKSLGRLWHFAGGKGQNLILCAEATPLHPQWACSAASALYFSRHACLGRSFYRNCFKYILSHTSMQPKKFKPCSWHSVFQYRWEFTGTICLSHLCFQLYSFHLLQTSCHISFLFLC